MRRNPQRHRQARRGKDLKAEALENRICLDSTVVFNEIMYNPPGATERQGEWIELHNQLSVDMDVSEWQLAGGVDYTFPDDTSPWPAAADGGGASLVKADPAKATHRESSWTFSRRLGGTPGTGHERESFAESFVLNEIASSAASDGEFFIELANVSNQSFNVDGIEVGQFRNE